MVTLNQKQRKEITCAVLLARYHTLTPLKPSPAYMRYVDIAKMLKVSYNRVVYICRRQFASKSITYK